jgi:hypothetical protein
MWNLIQECGRFSIYVDSDIFKFFPLKQVFIKTLEDFMKE